MDSSLNKADVLENLMIKNYPGVLGILLRDHTTQMNITWSTDNYTYLGNNYKENCHILPELITGDNGNVIMPRFQKNKFLQQSRSKEMAEVFTPAWICNAQNNLIDNAWFERENVFNSEKEHSKTCKWVINQKKISFPENKTWKDYIRDTRLEVACGEAPYITSRYDTATGEFIPIEERIGLLDRKLRVINENVDKSGAWLKAAQTAYKNTYAFEWQGDNLLLAREAMLISFIENYKLKFGKEPLLKSIKHIAYIISWNVWQMDGLKGVIPTSCKTEIQQITDLFGDKTIIEKECLGCKNNLINKHNGIYAMIRDWKKKDKIASKIKFIKLLEE